MNQTPHVQPIAAGLIRASCRRLPEEMRAERYREWSAEVHAILDDHSVRQGLVRAVRALRYSAGICRATRRLCPPRGGAEHAQAPGWRDGTMRAKAIGLAARIAIGVVIWLVVTDALQAWTRDRHGWPFILVVVLACCFDALCMADIVRAGKVRYLPKWAWALICVATVPGGGIAYLMIGRAGNPRPASPGSATTLSR